MEPKHKKHKRTSKGMSSHQECIDNVITIHTRGIFCLEEETKQQLVKIQTAEDTVFALPRDQYETANLDKLAIDRVDVLSTYMTQTNVINKTTVKDMENILGVKECSIKNFRQSAVLSKSDSITKQMEDAVAAWKVVETNLLTDIQTKK